MEPGPLRLGVASRPSRLPAARKDTVGDCECRAMNDVGKPCARKSHARFERGPLAKRNAHGEMEHAPDEKSSGLSPPTYRRTTSQRPTSQLKLSDPASESGHRSTSSRALF